MNCVSRLAILVALLLLPAVSHAQCTTPPTTFGCTFVDATSETITAGNLALSSPWNPYSGNDAPTAGEPNGFLVQRVDLTTVTATFTLTNAAQAGTPYNIFVQGVSYDFFNTFDCVIGGATSTTMTLSDRTNGPVPNPNRYWNGPITVTPMSTSSILTCTLHAANGEAALLFLAIRITSDLTTVVTPFSGQDNARVVNLTAPVARDNVIITGNRIVGGSFEGYSAGVWDAEFAISTNKVTDPRTVVDCTGVAAHSGSCGLAVPIDDASYATGSADSPTSILHTVLNLQPNKKTNASVWVKTSPEVVGNIACAFFIQNIFTDPNTSSSTWTFGISSTTVNSSTWTELVTPNSVNDYALAYPSPEYVNYVQCNGAPGVPGAKLYIDDWYLAHDTNTTFSATLSVTCVVATGKTANIFWTTDPPNGSYKCANSTGSQISKSFNYEIYNGLNQRVASGQVATTTAANSSSTGTIDFSTSGAKGFFTYHYWFEGENYSDREVNYSILTNYATTSGLDTTSAMGLHPTHLTYQLAGEQRMSIKWFRALSPAGIFIVQNAEPTEGSFTYFDSVISNAATYGQTVLGTLYCNNGGCPAYMTSGGLPDLTKFSTFMTNMVAHYKVLPVPVKYWECWNEPSFTATFYAQMMKACSDAVLTEDPTAHLVGMGGRSAAYMQSVIDAMDALYLPGWDWRSHYFIFSTHDYPGGVAPESLTTIVNTYSVEVWNTEWGAWDLGGYKGAFSNFRAPGTAIYGYADAGFLYNGLQTTPNAITNITVRSSASKVNKTFLYDARTNASPDNTATNTTILHYDNSIYPKGVAYATAGSFIDHTTTSGDACSNSNYYCEVFTRANTTCFAVLFSGDNLPFQITLSGAHGDYLLYDWYGNAQSFTGTVIPFGRNPVYLDCNGISTATLVSRLGAGVIASRADTTAPNLAILDGWRGTLPSPAPRVRFRWLALDQESLPSLGQITAEGSATDSANPDAILYDYWMDSDPHSGYGQLTLKDYDGLSTSGSHTFCVRAKDAAGNVSETVCRTFGQTATTDGQYAFRFRNDDGTQATATWPVAENTNIKVGGNTNVRVRFGINTVGSSGAQLYLLESKKSTDSTWQAVPASTPSQQVVTMTSSQTWIVPPFVTSIQAECVGGGGAGADSAAANNGGGGGKGGTYTKTNTYSVTPGSILTATVGLGGVRGTSPTDGGTSTLTVGASTICSAAGGVSATYNSQTGATGTTGSNVGNTITAGTSGGNGSGATSGAGGTGGAPLGGSGGSSVTVNNFGRNGVVPGGAGSGGSASVTTTTVTLTNASPQFTAPANVLSITQAVCRGAGANGGRDTNSGGVGAAGGGGGAYAVRANISVTPGVAYNATIPAGGSQSATSWTGNSGLGCSAAGATNVAQDATTGGAGASTGTGDTVRSGGNGGNVVGGNPGGGGEGACSTGTGNSAVGRIGGSGCDGGDGATGPTGNINGTNGTVPGGGGSGGKRTSGNPKNGGSGAAGNVALTYTTGATQIGGNGAAGSVIITYTATPPIVLSASSFIPAGGNTGTTPQLTPPAGKTVSSFNQGKISDDTNPMPSLTILSDLYSELEFSVKVLSANAVVNDIYDLRVTKNGTVLNAYDQTPQLTYVGNNFTVETAANGSGSVVAAQNVQGGGLGTVTAYCVERTPAGVFVANSACTWSLINKTAGVVNGDLVAAGDNKSAVFTGHALGTARIQVQANDAIGMSGTLTVIDTTAPTPGNSGIITTSGVGENSLTLNWTKATDLVWAQNTLLYRVYRSLSNNINSIANAKANGLVQGSGIDINSFVVTGPAITCGTTFYFSIIVTDGSGNEGFYPSISQATSSCTVGSGPGRDKIRIR